MLKLVEVSRALHYSFHAKTVGWSRGSDHRSHRHDHHYQHLNKLPPPSPPPSPPPPLPPQPPPACKVHAPASPRRLRRLDQRDISSKSEIHPVVPWLSWLERGANNQAMLTPRSRVQPPLEPFFLPFGYLPFGYIFFFFFLAETCFGDARILVFWPIIVRCRECNPLCAVGEDGWEVRRVVGRVCLPRFSPIAEPFQQQGEDDPELGFPLAFFRP